jgi:hypothetical protein
LFALQTVLLRLLIMGCCLKACRHLNYDARNVLSGEHGIRVRAHDER